MQDGAGEALASLRKKGRRVTMEAFKDEYTVAVLRPPVASRFSWAANELAQWDLERGLRIAKWIEHFRQDAARTAQFLQREVHVHEYQLHVPGSIVPNHDRRKRLKKADLIAVVDPDANFFQFLEEGPMRENPMVSVIICQLATNRDEIRSTIAQLPTMPLMRFNDDNTMEYAERVMDVGLEELRVLPFMIRRALSA
jgi:hypothetical protein